MSSINDIGNLYKDIYSLEEEFGAEYQKKGKAVVKQLTVNPIAKSSGAGALSPDAAEQLGPKATELRKKKLANVSLPTINKEEVEEDEEENIVELHSLPKEREVPDRNLKGLVKKAVKRIDTDVDGDTDNNDKAKGELGEFIPGVGNKRLYSNTGMKTALNNSFSDWRNELVDEKYVPWDFGPKQKAKKKWETLRARKEQEISQGIEGGRRTARRANAILAVAADMKDTLDKDTEATGANRNKEGSQPSTQRHISAAVRRAKRGLPNGATARKVFAPEETQLGEAHWNPIRNRVEDKPASKEEIESLAAKARTKKKERKPLGSIRKNSATFKPSSPEQAKADKASWDAYWEGSGKNEEYVLERTMTSSEKKKESRLKDKYDDSEMKQNMIDKYGKEKGLQIYYATIRKQAMDEEVDTRRAPAELVARLSARREGHMAQDGPNKAAYDAKQRLLDKIKSKKLKEEVDIDEAKLFPNAEDPWGSTDKIKHRIKHTIKNPYAGYKEGDNLKHTVMKREGRKGSVEEPKPSTAKNKKQERVVKTGEGQIITNMPKGARTPEEVFTRLEREASRRQSLERSSSFRLGKGAQAASDAADKDTSLTRTSREAANTSLRAKMTKPGKKIKLSDTTKAGPVKIIAQAQDKNANRKSPIKKRNISDEYQALYDDIIEALLDAEYALTVESADVLFESMTEDALSVIAEQYLEEKARGTRKKKTAHIYDMDETLYGHDHTKVRVHVNDASGKRVQSLSNQEFNTHKLQPGHKYDFSEFGSSKTFQKSAKPLKKMIKNLKRQKARGYDTHIVTARSDFDDKHHLAKQLKRHGVDITPNKQGTHTHLHRSGNEEGTDVGKKKQKVLSRLAQRHGYGKIHMYDDAEKVHQSTHGKTPGVQVKGHMVKPNKSGEVYSRPYKPTKPKGGKNNNN